MKPDLRKLAEAAKAEMPGTWELRGENGVVTDVPTKDYTDLCVGDKCLSDFVEPGYNAAFIAACSPDRILALAQQVADQAAEIERLRAERDELMAFAQECLQDCSKCAAEARVAELERDRDDAQHAFSVEYDANKTLKKELKRLRKYAKHNLDDFPSLAAALANRPKGYRGEVSVDPEELVLALRLIVALTDENEREFKHYEQTEAKLSALEAENERIANVELDATANLRARVAQLEADRDAWKENCEQQIELVMQLGAQKEAAEARVAELEARELETARLAAKAISALAAENVAVREAGSALCKAVYGGISCPHMGVSVGDIRNGLIAYREALSRLEANTDEPPAPECPPEPHLLAEERMARQGDAEFDRQWERRDG